MHERYPLRNAVTALVTVIVTGLSIGREVVERLRREPAAASAVEVVGRVLDDPVAVGDRVVRLVGAGGSAGIQFRGEALPDGEVKGYQAGVGPGRWGTLEETHGRSPLASPVSAFVYTAVFNPLDGRKNWGDLLPPFRQRLNDPENAGVHTIRGDAGTLHTYDAGSDPAMAFDSEGRGYFSCVAFDLASNAIVESFGARVIEVTREAE